ncbi:MAG: hypothetical protein U5K30_03450 [Acidimicrobiales bacterium]|nr:hypothetical protein [Acidimicrobiales bacterium]
MSGSIVVEPGELRAAVTDVAAATRALGRARGALESVGGLVAGGIDHGDRADDKVSTFVRQWRSEYDLVAGFLDAFRTILTDAAQCYEDLDAELAACLAEAGW